MTQLDMKSTPILLGPTAPAGATDGAAAAATAWGLRATAGWQDGSRQTWVNNNRLVSDAVQECLLSTKKLLTALAAFHNCFLPRAARITMP